MHQQSYSTGRWSLLNDPQARVDLRVTRGLCYDNAAASEDRKDQRENKKISR